MRVILEFTGTPLVPLVAPKEEGRFGNTQTKLYSKSIPYRWQQVPKSEVGIVSHQTK